MADIVDQPRIGGSVTVATLAWQEGAEPMQGTTDQSSVQVGRGLIVAVVAVVVVALTAWYLLSQRQEPLLPLETVGFGGELAHVKEGDLRAAVGPHLEAGWLQIDVAAVREAVEDLPWVKAVAIRRIWPDALHLTITEHEAMARWGEDGLLSQESEVFRPDERPGDLPLLAGPKGSAEQVATAYEELVAALETVGLEPMALRLDERRSWHARLASGTRIAIGRNARERRVERLVAAWPQLEGNPNMPERVDLRYPNGFAIRWPSDSADTKQSPEGQRDES